MKHESSVIQKIAIKTVASRTNNQFVFFYIHLFFTGNAAECRCLDDNIELSLTAVIAKIAVALTTAMALKRSTTEAVHRSKQFLYKKRISLQKLSMGSLQNKHRTR